MRFAFYVLLSVLIAWLVVWAALWIARASRRRTLVVDDLLPANTLPDGWEVESLEFLDPVESGRIEFHGAIRQKPSQS